MSNQIDSLEKTVVRGGDKTRKLEYVRIVVLPHVIVLGVNPSFCLMLCRIP